MRTPINIAVLAVAMAFAGSASAALSCKNDLGQTLIWHSGEIKPQLSAFDVSEQRTIICFVNSYALTNVLPAVQGIPYVPGIVTAADGPGLVYRGDFARFLLENIAAVEGKPRLQAYFDNVVP